MFDILKKKSIPPSKDELRKAFDENKEAFIGFIIEEQQKVISIADLERVFIDTNGKLYFRFPKTMSTPVERLAKQMEFNMYISSGIDRNEWLKIRDAMRNVLNDGLGNPVTASKLGALIEVLSGRLENIMHPELMYNIVAIQWIREDEDPAVFNQQIHNEKIEEFKKMVNDKGAYFFFQQTELGLVSSLLRLTPHEFTALWENSQKELLSLKPILDYIQSVKKSLSKEKVSKNKS